MATRTKAELERELTQLKNEKEQLIDYIRNYHQGSLECREKFLVDSGLVPVIRRTISFSFDVFVSSEQDYVDRYGEMTVHSLEETVEEFLHDTFGDIEYDYGKIAIRID